MGIAKNIIKKIPGVTSLHAKLFKSKWQKISIENNIRRLEKNYEALKSLTSPANGHATLHTEESSWFLWYEKWLNRCLEKLHIEKKLPQFLANRQIKKKGLAFSEDTLSDLFSNSPIRVADGKLHIGEVILPIPQSETHFTTYPGRFFDIIVPYILPTSDLDKIFSLMMFEGPYEYGNVTLEKGDIVIDAGACMGDFSAVASVKGCIAYAFEPSPEIINNYLSVTADNNKNITICPYALSDSTGTLMFNISHKLGGSKKASLSGKGSNTIKHTISVDSITLDEFSRRERLERIDFIKADIEGAERDMLTGAKNVLREFAPKIAICTYHLPDDPEVLRNLILNANPNYVIEEKYKKMYAYVPNVE